MKITVEFEFEGVEPDRELDVRRLVSSQLTPICESVQPTGWAWTLNEYDGSRYTIYLDPIVVG